MIYNILVRIDFMNESKRKWNIKNGYRPLFKIPNRESLFSGIINLIDCKELKPGESCLAVIGFFSDEIFQNLAINSKLQFYEGPNLVGYSIIKQYLGWDNSDPTEMYVDNS